ncbi:KTI12-like protein [Nymphaea thermarum]|nr:KTI12-like protein [Nymphaea thermarum]
MALVVMCGQPCSGKSTAACLLAGILRSQDLKVRLIDESSLHLDRNVAYADMTAEKNLRGVLRSEVDRSLSKDNIAIVDSLNNIKGYRYELWCLARATGIKYCVVYCDTEEDECRKWNKERGDRGEIMYCDKVLDDLIRRFEKPDRRNRWDYPLFELFPSKDGINESSTAVTDAVSYLTAKSTTKSRDVHVLQPTIATQNARMSDANSLYEMDQATQRPVGLPELRRLRKTFIKLTAQTSLSGPPPPSDADSVKRIKVSISHFYPCQPIGKFSSGTVLHLDSKNEGATGV